MRILFITAHRLGDAVISMGVLSELLERYPEARFTIVCGPMTADLFRAMPRCEKIIALSKRSWNRHWLDLWRRCVGKRWALVADLRSSPVSLALWARRRVIVPGGRRPGLKRLQQAQAFGFSSARMPTLWLTAEETAQAARLLPPESHWLALAPTAGTPAKMWGAARFAALSRRLSEEGLRPAVFYGPGETEKNFAAPLLDALPEAEDMGGGRSLGEVGALLQRCRLFVGNDSGLMHLAAAAGVPTLGLFGPSCASQYGPSGRAALALSAPGPEGAGRLDRLAVERVAETARRLERAHPTLGSVR